MPTPNNEEEYSEVTIPTKGKLDTEDDFEFEPRNPILAAVLSIIPGLGQIYNGQKAKGAGILVIFIFVGFTLAYSIYPIVLSFLIWIYSIVDAFITARKINEKDTPVVFILWGNFAKSKKNLITNPKHLVIESSHPSPFSCNYGFFGSRPFSKANNFLKEHNIKEIDFTVK